MSTLSLDGFVPLHGGEPVSRYGEVLGFAEVKIVSRFGLLMGITLCSALVCELLLTPAILLRFGPGERK